jgi:hypothetical protein
MASTQANGQVENFNKNLKKVIKSAINKNTDWNAFFRSYRNTPHSSTNKTPAELIFINCNTTRLPAKSIKLSIEQQNKILIAELNDKLAKDKM